MAIYKRLLSDCYPIVYVSAHIKLNISNLTFNMLVSFPLLYFIKNFKVSYKEKN